MSDPREPVIVGIGLSDAPMAPHLSSAQHHAQALQRALEDSGLALSEIDGYFNAGSDAWGTDDLACFMADMLGIRYRVLDGTFTGGASFEYHLQHAVAAIRAGDCTTALITYGSDQLSRMGRKVDVTGQARQRGVMQLEAPHGLPLAGAYALAAKRHMHEFGTTSENLACIAVAIRQWAGHNPNARYREPITVDDVLASKMIAEPLHLLDCCVVTDGGGAVLVTTAGRAKDLRKEPVKILSTATGQSHWPVSAMPDFTSTAARGFAKELYGRAGVTPADVDTAQLYDSFTITVMMLLEDLGMCEKGEGGAFAQSGALGPGGALPTNTDGGGLSSCHPGMRGIFLLIEAVRQLRGEGASSQVVGAEVALVAGSGGYLSGIGAALLAKGA